MVRDWERRRGLGCKYSKFGFDICLSVSLSSYQCQSFSLAVSLSVCFCYSVPLMLIRFLGVKVMIIFNSKVKSLVIQGSYEVIISKALEIPQRLFPASVKITEDNLE